MIAARQLLTLIAWIVAAALALAWATGKASGETVCLLAVGFLLIAAFWFVMNLLVRLPFQRLRASLASLLAIVLVLLAVLYALPLIEQYRHGYDLSDRLFHPLVFGGLGIGIVLLTVRR